jgi:pSer/pThr/pTyr-binding forkhead associated (FHA) protein
MKKDGQFTLLDLNSHNGTFVNGHQVRERILREGDLIQAGNSQFFFWLREVEELLAYESTEVTQSLTVTQQNPTASRNITARF